MGVFNIMLKNNNNQPSSLLINCLLCYMTTKMSTFENIIMSNKLATPVVDIRVSTLTWSSSNHLIASDPIHIFIPWNVLVRVCELGHSRSSHHRVIMPLAKNENLQNSVISLFDIFYKFIFHWCIAVNFMLTKDSLLWSRESCKHW